MNASPYTSGTALARRVIHSNATLALLRTEIGERAAVLGMLAEFQPANVVHIAEARNLLTREAAKQSERRFTAEPVRHSAFMGLVT